MSILEIIECPIYIEVFSDPRVLMCGHTICKNCINKYIQDNTFQCPICRRLHQTGLKGKIAKNYCFKELLSEYQKLKVTADIFEKTLSENDSFKNKINDLQKILQNKTYKLQATEVELSKQKLIVEKLQSKITSIEKSLKNEKNAFCIKV